MEYASFVSKIDHLKYCDQNFSRLYFGNEFCERLLPTPEELNEVLGAVQKDFTLVTPYVTDDGLERVRCLIDFLFARGMEAEVVFNDWGVFSLLKGRGPALKPVLGRLLNKMKRDPRLMNVMDRIPENTREYFRGSNLGVPVFRRFLLENGIKRAEFDNVLQQIDYDYDGIELSLYLPYVYVTTTRTCLVNACDIPERREQVGIFPCLRECRKYTFHLENDVMPVALIRRGNTLFFENEEIPPFMHYVSRVVIEPEIPM